MATINQTSELCIDFAYPSSPFAERHHKPNGCWYVWDTRAPLDCQDIAIADNQRTAIDWAYSQVREGLCDFSPLWLDAAKRGLACERNLNQESC